MSRSSWIIGVGPKSNDRCPCKRRTEQRYEENREDGGGDWSDVAASQVKQSLELEEARKDSPEPPE